MANFLRYPQTVYINYKTQKTHKFSRSIKNYKIVCGIRNRAKPSISNKFKLYSEQPLLVQKFIINEQLSLIQILSFLSFK